MVTRRPFWKRRCWKSIDSYPYTWVLRPWSLKLIFKAKVKLESGNQKIQYGRQAAILKLTSLRINRLLPMATINMHMKFEIEIPKQTWLMPRKPCRLQTDGRTDRRTDGHGESSIPPSNFVGRGYNDGEHQAAICSSWIIRFIFQYVITSCVTTHIPSRLQWVYQIDEFRLVGQHNVFCEVKLQTRLNVGVGDHAWFINWGPRLVY